MVTVGPDNVPMRSDPGGGGRIVGSPGVDPKVGLPAPKQRILAAAPKAAHPYGKAKGTNAVTGKAWTQAEYDQGLHLKKKPKIVSTY